MHRSEMPCVPSGNLVANLKWQFRFARRAIGGALMYRTCNEPLWPPRYCTCWSALTGDVTPGKALHAVLGPWDIITGLSRITFCIRNCMNPSWPSRHRVYSSSSRLSGNDMMLNFPIFGRGLGFAVASRKFVPAAVWIISLTVDSLLRPYIT
jgi:hypothetical protein